MDVAEGECFVGGVNLRRSENLQVGIAVLARTAAVNQQGITVQAVGPLRGIHFKDGAAAADTVARHFGHTVTVAVQRLVVLQVELRGGGEG